MRLSFVTTTFFVVILGFGSVVVAQGKPDAASQTKQDEAKYPLGDASLWLPQVKSIRLRCNVRYETTAEGIEHSLRELKAQFPDQKDFDPLDFNQLQRVTNVVLEYDVDQDRFRSSQVMQTEDKIDLSSMIRIWDGKRSLAHDRYVRSKQDGFHLSRKPDDIPIFAFQYYSYFRKQEPSFWWAKTPEAKAQFEQHFGAPADFVKVGSETFHGVDCDVWLKAVGNQSDRYYVGIKDKRWYGAKEGIIAFPDVEAFKKAYQSAVEESLGKKLGDNVPDSEWQTIAASLRTLPQEKKSGWLKLYYARVAKDFAPVFEYWFSDFRDIGNSRVIPHREYFVFYEHEDQKKIFVSQKYVSTITEIQIDQPVDDRLFKEEFTEDATIADDTHDPPVFYKYKKGMTAEEWQEIVKTAMQRQESDAIQQRKVEKLIGQAAPQLPTGEWLNSKPLKWADLRGKIVVLKFWSIGCGPCYNEIGVLTNSIEDNDAGKKNSQIPIVFIGVHTPGTDKEEIQKVIEKHKLVAPICLDLQQAAERPWGEFFDKCEVVMMPTSLAVDENGLVLAHGSLNDVLAAVSRHQEKASKK